MIDSDRLDVRALNGAYEMLYKGVMGTNLSDEGKRLILVQIANAAVPTVAVAEEGEHSGFKFLDMADTSARLPETLGEMKNMLVGVSGSILRHLGHDDFEHCGLTDTEDTRRAIEDIFSRVQSSFLARSGSASGRANVPR